MKHEWRKKEKLIYLPKSKPELVTIPKYKFGTISGEGNPNSQEFAQHIEALYSISYGIKMSKKKGIEPKGYFDYTVYPLEGVWDITDEAKENFNGSINKDDLVYKIMIRQPDFVSLDFFNSVRESIQQKKPNNLLAKLSFEESEEGRCIQMLHIGSYDNEPETFALMEAYASEQGLKRKSKIHREIYLSDARKVAPEKLKTVLRFQLK